MAELKVNATVLEQSNEKLYLFPMNSKLLRRLAYVTPKSEDTPQEIQRILDPKRAKLIGEYVQGANALLPNAIVVSLTPKVKIIETGTKGIVTLVFPADTGKFCYILDGQHRLAGFDYSEGVQFDLPVVALYNAPESLRGKVFADINSKQVKVSDTHLLSLYYQIKDLPPEDASTMDVVTMLNGDSDSPLYLRVKMKDDDKKRWVTNVHLKRCVAPHTASGGVLATRTATEQAAILKEYLKGVRDTWPDAWGDTQGYMLCRPMGLEIIFGVFGAAKHRCDLNLGKQYTAAHFRQMLAPIRDVEVRMPGGASISLDWRRGPMGVLSNKPGKDLIRKQLVDMLQAADED